MGPPLWSFGHGGIGTGPGQLAAPHTAEENPLNPDELIVAEQYGSAVVLLTRNRRDGSTALRTVFGERGVAKSGPSHIDVTHSAHFLPAGPFRGHVLATEYRGDHRIMILHHETGAILWQTGVLPVPLEAIYWDDAHIMCSDQERGIFKLALEDAAVVWHYDTEPHTSRCSFLRPCFSQPVELKR